MCGEDEQGNWLEKAFESGTSEGGLLEGWV